MPHPLLIAHRGDSAGHPENTAAAFESAIAAGVDGIELDVRLCADRVVVCHDGTLARFGAGGGALSRRSWRSLAEVDVGSWFAPRFADQRLLDLDGLLDRFAGRTTLLIELKPPRDARGRARLVAAVAAAIVGRGLAGRVLILGFELPVLRAVRRRAPALRLVWNRERPPRDLAAAARAGLHAIDLDRRRLTPGFAAACRDHGLRIFTYTANTAGELAEVRRCGVDAVLSDRPAWLVGRHRAR
jgi:glycerophosphoryl diester phosphodiesterase